MPVVVVPKEILPLIDPKKKSVSHYIRQLPPDLVDYIYSFTEDFFVEYEKRYYSVRLEFYRCLRNRDDSITYYYNSTKLKSKKQKNILILKRVRGLPNNIKKLTNKEIEAKINTVIDMSNIKNPLWSNEKAYCMKKDSYFDYKYCKLRAYLQNKTVEECNCKNCCYRYYDDDT